MTTIRAVLFDADGVVIHPNRFAEYLAREYGLTRDHTQGYFQGSFLDCTNGRQQYTNFAAFQVKMQHYLAHQ